MRTWPGLAAIGAGLIHLGIAAGSPVLQLALFTLVGALECGWGVLALARAPVPLPRAALLGLAIVVAAQVALLLAGVHEHASGPVASHAAAEHLPLGAMTGAVALDLATAALLAVHLRRGSGDREEHPLRFLAGVVAAAAVVAAVAVTSLAGTAVGAHHVH